MSRSDLTCPPEVQNDQERLASLRRYQILDTPIEKDFDDIAHLVAAICQTPIAVVNFIDENRQFFKAETGLGVRETPLNISICAHAILQRDLFIVPDTQLDERFANNPLVMGKPHLRFYAGALLRTPQGQPIGTLCVLDYKPRELTSGQLNALQTLATQVMTQLELRRALVDSAATELALRRAKADADAANHAKDIFLSFLSHELRNPLTPALLTATAMAGDENQSPETRADAAMIRRNIELVTHLADDLLDVSRITHGKLELRMASTNLHALLVNAMAMCQPDAVGKQLKLGLDLRADSFFVDGEPAKLTQVITNLVKNAIKFTPAGGVITLRTMNVPGEKIRIEVSDTGIGVEASFLPRMFNLYEQGGPAVTREHAGLGLGLAICKGIVEAHGGTIAAVSPGKGLGTTMMIDLSLGVMEHAPSVPAAVKDDGVAKPASPVLDILLVDDHHDTLRAMSRLLKHLQHRVTTASCVTEALAEAKQKRFDLLISDVGLPDGTGSDLMRELLKRQPIRGIALTGYGSEADIERTREAGFMAHLVKPINFTQLQSLLMSE